MSSNTDKTKDMFRIMSLDGGGIYGLFTVYMLKQLCQDNPNFLKKGCVNLFAGTSVGALNALLLAKYDNPRDAVLGGEMEDFYANPLLFSNLNPICLMTSKLGMSPSCGTQDYLCFLNHYIGGLTLGDLKQNVLLTTFDWSGGQNAGENRNWKPKLFENFDSSDPDWKQSVVDVAFSCTSPSYLRAIWNGKQDGGFFAPNPSMCAITKVVHDVFDCESEHRVLQKLFIDAIKDEFPDMKKIMKEQILDHLSVFSVGVGNVIPFLPVDTEEWGMIRWMMGMWNPMMNKWVMPMLYYQFDPSMEDTNYQARQLLNRSYVIDLDEYLKNPKTYTTEKQHVGYHRLSPQVLRMSLTLANILVINNPVITYFIRNEIHRAACSDKSAKEVKETEKWLEDENWFAPDHWIACHLYP